MRQRGHSQPSRLKFTAGSSVIRAVLLFDSKLTDIFSVKSIISMKQGHPTMIFSQIRLKRYFRLSGVPSKLCRSILGCAIIFLSVSYRKS